MINATITERFHHDEKILMLKLVCCLFIIYYLHMFKNKKKGIKILVYSSVIYIHHIDVIFFCNNYNKRLGAIWEGCFKRFGMTFAAFYRKMQFCNCPGVGHLHTFLKPYHDEVFVSQRKPNVLSSLLRIRNGMNGLIENISSINPFFARPSGAFITLLTT